MNIVLISCAQLPHILNQPKIYVRQIYAPQMIQLTQDPQTVSWLVYQANALITTNTILYHLYFAKIISTNLCLSKNKIRPKDLLGEYRSIFVSWLVWRQTLGRLHGTKLGQAAH